MSMTFDDLCEVYQTAALALPDKGGIRAVVKALRDEMLNDMALHTSLIDSDDVTEWFNEILAQSEARQAGVLAVESREVAMVPEATEAPAADPSPAVCEWRMVGKTFANAGCEDEYLWSHEYKACPSCGKPIAFKEVWP